MQKAADRAKTHPSELNELIEIMAAPQIENKPEILFTGWYKETGKEWHEDPKFNMIGEWIAYVRLNDLKVEDITSIHCNRWGMTSLVVSWHDPKDNYPPDGVSVSTQVLTGNAMYLDSTWEVLAEGIVRVRVPLSWYVLGYSYDLNGEESPKEDLLSWELNPA